MVEVPVSQFLLLAEKHTGSLMDITLRVQMRPEEVKDLPEVS